MKALFASPAARRRLETSLPYFADDRTVYQDGVRLDEFAVVQVALTPSGVYAYVCRKPVVLGEQVLVHGELSGVVKARVVGFGTRGYLGPFKLAEKAAR